VSITRLKLLKRKKIEQKDITITLENIGKTKKLFTASLKLDDYGLPPEARIFIDAHQLLETMRFDFGTVGTPAPTTPRDISRLTSERVLFSVAVLAPANGRKLATAEALRPRNETGSDGGSIPLLPVDASKELEGPIWSIAYEGQDEEGHNDAPVLQIDRKASNGAASGLLQDGIVRALVLPSAMREILTRVLIADEHPFASDSRAWRDCWLRFAGKTLLDDVPSSGAPEDERLQFVDAATKAFARRNALLEGFLMEKSR
jgi:hypothetical protein